MSNFIVKRVAVLGAGVMGAQIAAHCVNAKVPVVLFDLPAREGPKNGIVLKAIEGLKKLSPAPLGNKDDAACIEVANYDDDLELLKGCDLIIEAIAFKKATSLGFVSGILAGLVVITPAAGVVQPVGALTLGAASSLLCYFALTMKMRLGYDDSLDCFGIHGIGSGLGVLLLSFFIRDSWMAKASTAAGKTWTAFDQLQVQLLGMGATIVLAASVTFLICLVVEKTVGFRIDQQSEIEGLDKSLHGESGYGMAER